MSGAAHQLGTPLTRLPSHLRAADVDAIRVTLSHYTSPLVLDASAVCTVDPEVAEAFTRLANDADAAQMDVCMEHVRGQLAVVTESGRLHRRFCIAGREVEAPARVDEPALALSEELCRDPKHLATTIADSDAAEGAALLRWLMQYEDTLYSNNALAPYRDVMPAVVAELAPARCAEMLFHLSDGDVMRLMFGDYTEIPDRRIAEVFECGDPARTASLFASMLGHPDLCRRVGGVLRELSAERRDEVLGHQPRLAAVIEADLGHSGQDDSATAWTPDVVDSYAAGYGVRKTRPCPAGRHVEIEEVLDGASGPKRVRIDLLELDPAKVRLATHSAGSDRPDYDAFEAMFAPFSETGRPTERAFRDAGLFRLGEVARGERAIAGINGGFYFDYGHYTNGKTLGLDFAQSAGLRFGDPIGYFVMDGVEISAPIFNRATLLVTDRGVFIRRVKLVGVASDEVELRWTTCNRDVECDGAVMFSSLWGATAPEQPKRVQIVLAAGEVADVVEGGGAPIPFTGVVVSLPANSELRGCFTKGTRVRSVTDVPAELGRVEHAVACGPALVRDGRVSLDFDGEEFGRKDSPVISFFLPRLAESYEAARSFIGTRADGTLVLGTISGRAFGAGDHDSSAGMTFGEMAVLAGDLGLVDAMGLDGGGSSSLDILEDDGIRILNIPTGGSDVPRGAERFIANALLVFPR